MNDGIIYPSATAPFGFSAALFDGWLWKEGDTVFISFIESLDPGKGNFKQLVDNILACGYNVNIPTPLGNMNRIVNKNGYKKTVKYDNELGENVELWVLKPRGI